MKTILITGTSSPLGKFFLENLIKLNEKYKIICLSRKKVFNNLLDLKTLIGKTYNLDNINDAIDGLRSSTDSGRIMIKF